MMSMGKVSSCRKYWIAQGVLAGKLRRDPGYPQPVYHLKVKNIWKANVDWCETHASIQARIEFKHTQAESLHQVKAKRASLHVVKPSPGEEGITPHEEGVSPGETKNNRKKNHKNNRERAAQSAPRRLAPAKPALDPLLDHPAIVSYRQIMQHMPNAVQRQAIAYTVGQNGHLDDWRTVLTNWQLSGYKPGNVAGQLDKFKKVIGGNHASTPPSPSEPQPSANLQVVAERINAARAAKQQPC